MKAIIIGGGIAGLAMAKGLEMLKWDVCLYEQAPELKPAGAGIVLSANALKALKVLGLYEAVDSAGNKLRKFSILKDTGATLTTTNYLRLSQKYGHTTAMALHRTDLQQALLSQLTTTQVIQARRCLAVTQNQHKVQVHFEGGESVEGDLLLACDGIHSAVRKSIYPENKHEQHPLRFAGYTCWRGVTSEMPAKLDSTHATESWGKGRRFGIVPLSDGRVYWFACLNAAKPKDPDMAQVDLPRLQHLFSSFHEPVQEILSSTPPDSLLWNDILDLKPIPSFTQGRVALLGDAAHATTPNMGQGACQALEDAAVLAGLLARHPHEKAFTEYDRLRIPRTQEIVKKSWQLGKITQLENPLAVKLRNLFMRSIPAKVNQRQLDELMKVEFETIANLRGAEI